ncbi:MULTISPECIES: ABC transporter ATP-binding protein [Clostridium]|uniref:ABC transporter ATP-binding protein n=1 Tax=Clostridium TaxID=1485 RepID=UPI000C08BD3E|nr:MULTISPECIES: ABC transporter ATP-binding protein [Clostridium]MDB2118045.1 ABC transporter ATP-binding protein [Clostridium paraputrificum]MDU1031279.1 ABC transporter ATP-binding protein [Clostridium sp.]MDU5742015.1 ABC transporter ATP-binding protein [Clostridium sp.]MDU5786433.1 ABC transporter ATP-binding protein [Clostridium sp.]MDU6809743.1 ABC transporter ATP-binding protein [Clostridium sp.]
MNFLYKYFKKYYKMFFLAVGCVMLEVLCDLLQPTLMSIIIDNGISTNDMSMVLKYGFIMIGVSIFGAFIAINRNRFATTVAQDFGADLRLDVFNKIQSFDFDNIDKFERGSLITRLTNDITNIQNFIYGLMRIFVRAPLLAIGCIIMSIRLDLKMALIVLTIVPIVGGLIYLNLRYGYPYFLKVQRAIDKVNGVIREYLRGVRVVKAFNRFDFEEERFENVNDDLTCKSIASMRFMAVFNPIITLIVNIAIAIIIWSGATRVNLGTIQVGKVVAFTNYMTQLLFALMSTTMIFSSLIRAKTSSERINEIFLEENNIKEIKDKTYNSSEKGNIKYENVTFSYKGLKGDPIIDDISFTLERGMTLGIVGSTGSGKTTLVNLIPRFYDAKLGKILIDGIDIRNYTFEELRAKISIVPQKTVLFSGTIKENIRWGKEDATDDEIVEVCKIADADSFISGFNKGYDSIIGQGGSNLSGGQKQRIAIARALIKRPEILILDDSTSALDTDTEYRIRKSLKEYSKDMTTILIAQKVSSVINADKIIVLDHGKIVGEGTHDELMSNCETYKDIYKSQQ